MHIIVYQLIAGIIVNFNFKNRLRSTTYIDCGEIEVAPATDCTTSLATIFNKQQRRSFAAIFRSSEACVSLIVSYLVYMVNFLIPTVHSILLVACVCSAVPCTLHIIRFNIVFLCDLFGRKHR